MAKRTLLGTLSAMAILGTMPAISQASEPAGPGIRLCSVGYLPEAPKTASVAGVQTDGTSFEIVDADSGKVVHQGLLGAARYNKSTGETLRATDFSALSAYGSYLMRIEGLPDSAPFKVAPDALNRSLLCVMIGFYGQRCGQAVSFEWDGVTFSHDTCHMDDGYLDYLAPAQSGQKRDGTGGWHDAGDYGKYTVNSAFSMGLMLAAWERNGEALKQLRLPIPESGGALPDYLAEIKYNLDWQLKMQFEDGKVAHKLTELRFGGMIMPEDHDDPRYFSPVSKIATIDFAAIGCMAARVYEQYDPAYAAIWREAAKKAWIAQRNMPAEVDISAFSTGTYLPNPESDTRWALVEVALTFGEEFLLEWEREFLHDIVDNDNAMFDVTWDWGKACNLGLYDWLFSDRAKEDPAAYERLKKDLFRAADAIVANRNSHGYGRGIRVNYWGCNGAVARTSLNLHAAYLISGDTKYLDAAYDQIAYLYGRNPFARSFVTGDGHKPPMYQHHRPSAADGIEPPWPGHLSGGANPRETDWFDETASYRTNENAINWDAALVYALSIFYRP